jgi:glycine oxidase
MADCDVAVVGAGVIGLAVAYELASRGASVILLDTRGAGSGATQAAAGMLVPFIEGAGHPLLPMAARSLGLYDEFVERLTRDTGIDAGYSRTGSLQVITDEESLDELKRVGSGVEASGLKCQLLDAQQTHDAEPHLTPNVQGSLLIPEHGFVGAIALSRALYAGAAKHGARVNTPARVHRISPRGQAIDIYLDGGKLVTAHQVVVAAGSWTGELMIDGIRPLPIRPVRGQLLQIGWVNDPLKRIVWGPDCYVVPSAPGTVLVGATVEEVGFDERTTVAAIRDLLDAASDLLPAMWQASFTEARVGLRPGTPDDMPVIGRSSTVPGVVYATGHFRNGILLAPFTAQVVGDLVLEKRTDPLLAAASPQRFGEY